jgi:hypothetical protein
MQMDVEELKLAYDPNEELNGIRSPLPGSAAKSGGFLAEEAFAAFADVLLRSSISDSNRRCDIYSKSTRSVSTQFHGDNWLKVSKWTFDPFRVLIVGLLGSVLGPKTRQKIIMAAMAPLHRKVALRKEDYLGSATTLVVVMALRGRPDWWVVTMTTMLAKSAVCAVFPTREGL